MKMVFKSGNKELNLISDEKQILKIIDNHNDLERFKEEIEEEE